MSIDWSKVQQAITQGANLDLSTDIAAFETGDIQGMFKTVEDGIDIVSIFIPEAAEIERAVAVLAFLVYAYQNGLIQSARVEDPAMARVERDRGGH